MGFERTFGCILLAFVLVSYVISRMARDVNWAMHMFYLKKWLSVW